MRFQQRIAKTAIESKGRIKVLRLIPGILALITATASVPTRAAAVVAVVLVTALVIICEREADETGSSNTEQCGTRIDDLLGSAIGIIRRGAVGAGGKNKGNGDGTNQ